MIMLSAGTAQGNGWCCPEACVIENLQGEIL